MIKYLFTAAMLLVYFPGNGQAIPIPEGYEKLDEKEGDLTNDHTAEKVIVYNTSDSTELGKVREIQIYKKSVDKWDLLASSNNAIGKSEEGRMTGDPFDSIEIKDGVLLIKQSGGSNWVWSKTDKYRFQDGQFQLIGYTNYYGKACEYFETIDFNLLTGKISYEKEYQDCDQGDQKIKKNETETFYKKGIKIYLANRASNEIKIVTPKYKHEIYL